MDTKYQELDEGVLRMIHSRYPDGLSGELSNSDSEYLRSFLPFFTASMSVDEAPNFLPIFVSAINKGNFDDVRRYIAEAASNAPHDNNTSGGILNDPNQSPQSREATLKSFQAPYRGTASHHLYEQMKAYLALRDGRQFYSRCLPIVQSSGTGKSRMVDELAKKVVMANVNLSLTLDVFPPPDIEIRTFLSVSEQRVAAMTMQGYLYATLRVAIESINAIIFNQTFPEHATDEQSVANRVAFVASIFRDKMNEGQTFEKHGTYHTNFYIKVKEYGDKFVNEAQKRDLVKTNASPVGMTASPDFGNGYESLEQASKDLCHIFDRDGVAKGKVPFFVFTFDESHTLAMPQHDESTQPWTNFSEMRRALRRLRTQPFFGIFLSTSGKLDYSSPNSRQDPSSRMANEQLKAFDPYFFTDFDQLMKTVYVNSSTALHDVVSDEFIAHVGRPLFGARYDHGDLSVQRDILEFAATKLVCTSSSVLDKAAKLACLAVRLPLEFKATTWLEGDAERVQVERHLRVCISASPGFDKILTHAPSEPLLAEAAYTLMNDPTFDVPAALDSHLDSSYLCKGERGELIASLILLLARDAAVRKKTRDASGSHRIISIPEFLKALLNPKDYRYILKAASANDSESRPLGEAFRNSHVYFNHFAKAGQQDMMSQKGLWDAMVRGAALLCANYQEGIDIVIPFLHESDILQPENISCILIQVKNADRYTSKPKWRLFSAIDPFDLEIFKKATSPTPPPSVIRIVFALAAMVEPGKASITARAAPTRRSGRTPRFHGYDFWCAGCTSETFNVIAKDQENTYRNLLKHTLSHPAPFTQPGNNKHLIKMWPLFRPKPPRYLPTVQDISSGVPESEKSKDVPEDVPMTVVEEDVPMTVVEEDEDGDYEDEDGEYEDEDGDYEEHFEEDFQREFEEDGDVEN